MPVNATSNGTPQVCNPDAPILPGTIPPAPLPVSCQGQNVFVSKTPSEPTKGTPLLTRTHTVNIPGKQEAVIDHVMRDINGAPVDLQGCLCITESSDSSSNSVSSSTSSESCSCEYKLVFRLSEYLSGANCEFPVEVVDAATGQVRVTLTPENTAAPGVFFGNFAIVVCEPDAAGENAVIFSNTIYVHIGRNLWNTSTSCSGLSGPPSIAEVRMHLRDTDPTESFLLDNLAFTDDEIMQAMWLPVQYWNEIPPDVGLHTTQTFPYRYHWLMAIAGYLFLTVAEQQRRNNLRYSAAGVNIDDQAKQPDYEQAAKRRLEEFRYFVQRKKAELNVNQGFSIFGSDYN